ncbi:MAG: (E)-4-hydroxy-3-methylbut-2-enyl-diphosphate synthase, partial [Verrucomicrobiota bacterium]
GMVESALEFARIARDLDYHAFVFSMKSSNPKVMINAYRLLVARLAELDAEVGSQKSVVRGDGILRDPTSDLRPPTSDSWSYPIHLGVTEAGEGEDARIKSAIGIGSLLRDGIGDTIRVSLTEDSIHEIPVAKALVEMMGKTPNAERPTPNAELSFDPFSYSKRPTETIERDGVRLGGEELIRVVVRQESFDKVAHKIDRLGDYKPEIVYEKARVQEIDPRDDEALTALNAKEEAQLVTVRDDVELPVIVAFRLLASKLAARHPILL